MRNRYSTVQLTNSFVTVEMVLFGEVSTAETTNQVCRARGGQAGGLCEFQSEQGLQYDVTDVTVTAATIQEEMAGMTPQHVCINSGIRDGWEIVERVQEVIVAGHMAEGPDGASVTVSGDKGAMRDLYY